MGDGEARVGITRLMPAERFIAELKKLGYRVTLRVPAADADSGGEVLHIKGPPVNRFELRRIVGEAKVAALLSKGRKTTS